MTNEPDEFPPEFLAGYVDGELGGHDCERVERWLAAHPEARELLETQESLAPANCELYFALTPPPPSSRQWSNRSDAITHGLQQSLLRRQRTTARAAAMILATAAVVVLLISPTGPNRPAATHATANAVVASEAPFPMAGDDDVRIVSLPEDAAALLVVGEHPLAGLNLILAGPDEVEFFGIGSDLAGRFPERPDDPLFEEPPVLWAPRDP